MSLSEFKHENGELKMQDEKNGTRACQDSNLESSDPQSDALSIAPHAHVFTCTLCVGYLTKRSLVAKLKRDTTTVLANGYKQVCATYKLATLHAVMKAGCIMYYL